MATGTDAGRVPRTIECELTGDLVDSGVPGDVVTVSGTIKVLNPDLEKPGTVAHLTFELALYRICLI